MLARHSLSVRLFSSEPEELAGLLQVKYGCVFTGTCYMNDQGL